MTSQEHVPRPDRQPLLRLLFGVGVVLLGVWAAWLTHSWVVLAVALFIAVVPARTHGGDMRTWARRRARGN